MTLTQRKMGKKANWHKGKHGLITKAKISFGLQNKKGRAQKRIGEGEKRRGEEKEKKKKKKKRRGEERKSKKVWNYDYEYGSLDFLVWIHVLGCKKPNPRMNSCMEIITNPFVSLGFCYERT